MEAIGWLFFFAVLVYWGFKDFRKKAQQRELERKFQSRKQKLEAAIEADRNKRV